MMKKVLLMTTLFTAAFASDVQAEALIVTENSELNQSATYDYLEVQAPNYFHFYGDGNVLTLTGNTDSIIGDTPNSAFFIIGGKSELSLAQGTTLNVVGDFIAEGAPSLYTKNVGGKTFFDAEKYKDVSLSGITKVSGNIHSSLASMQIGGTLSVLTSSGEVVNELDYSYSEYRDLVANKTITEYETPAHLFVDGDISVNYGNFNFTKGSFLEVSGKTILTSDAYFTGDVNLKSDITITGGGDLFTWRKCQNNGKY